MAEVARTVVRAWDADGNPVEPGDPTALRGEAIEYDAAGNELRRLYLSNEPAPPEPTEADAVDAALTAEPGEWTDDLPQDLEALIEYVGGQTLPPDVLLDRVAAVILLPTWENAPAELQRQVYAYLAG